MNIALFILIGILVLGLVITVVIGIIGGIGEESLRQNDNPEWRKAVNKDG